jgi:hypothetical protein
MPDPSPQAHVTSPHPLPESPRAMATSVHDVASLAPETPDQPPNSARYSRTRQMPCGPDRGGWMGPMRVRRAPSRPPRSFLRPGGQDS